MYALDIYVSVYKYTYIIFNIKNQFPQWKVYTTNVERYNDEKHSRLDSLYFINLYSIMKYNNLKKSF